MDRKLGLPNNKYNRSDEETNSHPCLEINPYLIGPITLQWPLSIVTVLVRLFIGKSEPVIKDHFLKTYGKTDV
jgi:hypothetical protein